MNPRILNNQTKPKKKNVAAILVHSSFVYSFSSDVKEDVSYQKFTKKNIDLSNIKKATIIIMITIITIIKIMIIIRKKVRLIKSNENNNENGNGVK